MAHLQRGVTFSLYREVHNNVQYNYTWGPVHTESKNAPQPRPANMSASVMLARVSSSCRFPSLHALSFEPLLTDVPIDVGNVHVHFLSHALERPPVNYREGNLKRTVGRLPWRQRHVEQVFGQVDEDGFEPTCTQRSIDQIVCSPTPRYRGPSIQEC